VGTVGFDAGKRVKGRKRHVAVDSLGLPLAIVVVTGAQVQDNEPAAVALLFVRACGGCSSAPGVGWAAGPSCTR